MRRMCWEAGRGGVRGGQLINGCKPLCFGLCLARRLSMRHGNCRYQSESGTFIKEIDAHLPHFTVIFANCSTISSLKLCEPSGTLLPWPFVVSSWANDHLTALTIMVQLGGHVDVQPCTHLTASSVSILASRSKVATQYPQPSTQKRRRHHRSRQRSLRIRGPKLFPPRLLRHSRVQNTRRLLKRQRRE